MFWRLPIVLAAASAALCVPAIAAEDSLLDDALGVLRAIERPAPAPGDGSGTAGLGQPEIADGLLEALRVGTGRVVDAVGRLDGFNADSEIHIPLPGWMRDAQSALEMVGLGALGEDLELRLNRAAEAAAPEARALFVDAIAQMTLDDVMAIYEGPDDAATRYFQRTMTPPLVERMRPIVTTAMSEAGAVRAYDEMMAPYQALPLMPDVKGDLSDYTVTKTLDGLFHKLAQEEAAIRRNPAARTTALLQRVFGGL
jgi:hypothetical protein